MKLRSTGGLHKDSCALRAKKVRSLHMPTSHSPKYDLCSGSPFPRAGTRFYGLDSAVAPRGSLCAAIRGIPAALAALCRVHMRETHMRSILRFFVVLLVGSSFLLPAAGAHAAQPNIDKYQREFERNNADACGEEVDILYRFDLQVIEQTFFNKAGEPTKFVIFEQGTRLVERSDNKNTFISRIHVRIVFDLVGETTTATGTVRTDTLPGEGVIIQETGRIVFDGLAGPAGSVLFSAGKHDEILGEVFPPDVYCEVLA